MQNIKYHFLNTVSIILFAYITAFTVNQFVRYSMAPTFTSSIKKFKSTQQQVKLKSFESYQPIIESGFFRIAREVKSPGEAGSASNLTDLQLLGTISGPPAIARALIKKNTEKDPQIFRIWTDVYGYKLVRIDNSRVYLKSGKSVEILDMFASKEKQVIMPGQKDGASGGQIDKIKQSISRAELQQKVLNNMDNALAGLRAGPYRVDNKIEGYKIFRIKPNTILYELGARNGDIIKRINGHPLDSTEKLYKMWDAVKGDARITVDLDRGGRLHTYEFTVTE